MPVLKMVMHKRTEHHALEKECLSIKQKLIELEDQKKFLISEFQQRTEKKRALLTPQFLPELKDINPEEISYDDKTLAKTTKDLIKAKVLDDY